MRRALLIVLAGTSISALAANWQPLADYATVSAEVDATSIQSTGNFVEASFRFTHASPQTNVESGAKYLSAMVQARFDCGAKTFLPYQRVEYSGAKGQGTIVATVIVPEAKRKFDRIAVGSMNESMFERACSLK
jgi:hypothetical protein